MEKPTVKRKHIMTLLRQARNMRMQDLMDKTGHGNYNISAYETYKKSPTTEVIERLSKGLNVDPEILYYSFGYLPDKEKSIIMSDPFYYMDKIKRICNNTRRQNINDEEMNELNNVSVLEYIVKGLKDDTGD